jgi:hypothetical protein
MQVIPGLIKPRLFIVSTSQAYGLLGGVVSQAMRRVEGAILLILEGCLHSSILRFWLRLIIGRCHELLHPLVQCLAGLLKNGAAENRDQSFSFWRSASRLIVIRSL